MTLRKLKLIVGITCVISIIGMIVTAITNHLGGVIAFGSVSSVSILTMIAAATVVRNESSSITQPYANENLARQLENSIATLADRPNSEADLRDLVKTALEYAKHNT